MTSGMIFIIFACIGSAGGGFKWVCNHMVAAINTGKMRTLEDLAATFQISQVAMVQRLKQVGVI